MSFFLCGNFILRDDFSQSKRNELAFQILDLGRSHKLSIQLGVCIVQDIVFEIIGETRGLIPETKLPFLITDSPLSDVSDILIDYADPDNGPARLRSTLTKLHGLFDDLKLTTEVSKMLVFFTEGFDTDYKIISSSLETFEADCLKEFVEAQGNIGFSVDIEL